MVYNYTKFSKEILINNIEQYNCTCHNDIFKDEFHNHVVTGSLDVLQDESLKGIFKFGSKFRIIPKLNKNNIITNINNNVNEYIHRLSFKLNVNIGLFAEWKTKFINNIRNVINYTPNTFHNTTNIRELRDKIKIVQDKFIIVPVDKASNNFGFICKKYYAQVLINEMNASDTFEISNVNLTNIKELNLNFLKTYKLTPSYFNIPFMYCIPKFHKQPTKFRYITSSFNCINKDVNIILNLTLDKLYEKINNESENCWIIKNNSKVLENISRCNDNPGVPGNHTIATFDFSTLYTALPHKDLIRCIVALYNKYIHTDLELKYKHNKLVINKIQFVKMLKFCINNNYVLFNNRIYRQKIGIPMGSNFSPNLANLYLHFYEAQFMAKNHEPGRYRYRMTSRFIDDLLSINNRDIIYDIRSIYPNSLIVNNTNVDPFKKSSFLDMDIKVDNNKLLTNIYDKRRDFNFEILGLPAFLSNIPNNLTYGIISSQFTRFARVCMKGHEYIENCQTIINKIRSNGFPSGLLKKYIIKFKRKKGPTIAKFNFDQDLDCLLEF